MRERTIIMPLGDAERARDGVVEGAVEEAVGVGGGDDQVEFRGCAGCACTSVFVLSGEVGEGAVEDFEFDFGVEGWPVSCYGFFEGFDVLGLHAEEEDGGDVVGHLVCLFFLFVIEFLAFW